MSNHFTVNQRNACIFQPLNPQNGLPTTFLERKLFDFSALGNNSNAFERKISSAKYDRKAKKTIHQASEKLSHHQQVLSSANEDKNSFVEDSLDNCHQNRSSISKIKDKNSFVEDSLDDCHQSRSSTSKLKETVEKKIFNQPESKILYESPNPEDLKRLIEDDEKFFNHLQFLKNENKKTLEKLDKLYNVSLGIAQVGKNKKKCAKEFTNYYKNIKENETSLWWSSSEDDLNGDFKIVPQKNVNSLNYKHNEFRGRPLSYDVISNMWDNFSVDEYVPYIKTVQHKSKSWSPSITIPEPFQMTIRDESKSKRKSKKIEKIEEELLLKQLREEAELNKKIVPTPIPASTFLPLYEEINEQQERNREYIRSITKQMLKSTERPFSFIKREEAKKELKRSHSTGAVNLKKKDNQFHAKPYPEQLFDLSLADRMAEQEEYRKIKIKLRAQELLASSSLPPNMRNRGSMRHLAGKKPEGSKKESCHRKSFQPVVHHEIPDFESLHKKIVNELEEKKNLNLSTVCNPFELKTMKIPERRLKFKKMQLVKNVSDNASSQKRNYTSARPHNNERERTPQRTLTTSHVKFEQSPSYSLTETARLRQERLKLRLEKDKIENLKKSIEETKKRKKHEGLRKLLVKKVAAQDPARNREIETEEKLKRFREADYERRCDYEKYLHDVNTKMSMRPLLFEQESQTNAKLKANRRYEEILRDAGIDENDLDAIMNHQVITPIKQMSIDDTYDKSSEKSSDLSRANSNQEVNKSNIPSEDEVFSDQDDFKDSIAENKKADPSNISESEDRAFSANDDDSNDGNNSDSGSYKQA